MSQDQQHTRSHYDNTTPPLRAWRVGGPMTAAQRRESKKLFLEHLSTDPNVSAAADYAGIHRDTAYRWREKDQQFAKGWEQSVERLNNQARSAIFQRGIVGWEEPVVSMGQLVYEQVPVLDEQGEQVYEKGKPKMRRGNPVVLRKWSDQLAIAYAKANLPEYKERQQIDLTAQITDMADMAKEELLADLAASIANDDKDHQSQEQE